MYWRFVEEDVTRTECLPWLGALSKPLLSRWQLTLIPWASAVLSMEWDDETSRQWQRRLADLPPTCIWRKTVGDLSAGAKRSWFIHAYRNNPYPKALLLWPRVHITYPSLLHHKTKPSESRAPTAMPGSTNVERERCVYGWANAWLLNPVRCPLNVPILLREQERARLCVQYQGGGRQDAFGNASSAWRNTVMTSATISTSSGSKRRGCPYGALGKTHHGCVSGSKNEQSAIGANTPRRMDDGTCGCLSSVAAWAAMEKLPGGLLASGCWTYDSFHHHARLANMGSKDTGSQIHNTLCWLTMKKPSPWPGTVQASDDVKDGGAHVFHSHQCVALVGLPDYLERYLLLPAAGLHAVLIDVLGECVH